MSQRVRRSNIPLNLYSLGSPSWLLRKLIGVGPGRELGDRWFSSKPSASAPLGWYFLPRKLRNGAMVRGEGSHDRELKETWSPGWRVHGASHDQTPRYSRPIDQSLPANQGGALRHAMVLGSTTSTWIHFRAVAKDEPLRSMQIILQPSWFCSWGTWPSS